MHTFPLPFRNACFLLCIYIGHGSTLVAFLVLKCLCFDFIGYLVKFQSFVGMHDLERDKMFKRRLFRRLSNGDNARSAVMKYQVSTCAAILNIMFERVAAGQNSHMYSHTKLIE